jgi:hypothetical protein
MTRITSLSGVCALLLLVGAAHTALADSASCQKVILKGLLKFEKKSLKAQIKCLKDENALKLPGPCPDAATQLTIQGAATAATSAIASACTSSDVAALGYRADCTYESNTVGREATCAALPVGTDPTQLAQCLECWKGAELSEYVAVLFASHAVGICAGTTSAQSSVCSDLDCTTPLPDQRNLTGGEGTCQLGIGKAGYKYLIKREKTLEKCALAGGTQASCLADLNVQATLTKLEQKKTAKIKSKCGNRSPAPSTPFCCKTGMANQCSAATSRDDCTMNLGGTVQEGKTCSMGTCASVMGNQEVTWWGFCPESDTCPGTALSTLTDLIGCVDTTADAISDELLCLQLRGNAGADWPCPASE